MPGSEARTAVRKALYDQIVLEVQAGISRYYSEYPERLGDERAKDALDWSLRGTQRILRLLDGYDISVRKPPA